MLRALVRKALADLKGQRLQGAAMVVIVAAATATLVLAMTLRSSTSNPWERVFSQTHGAHVNFTVEPGTNLDPVFGLDGIDEIGEPYPTIWDQRLIHGLDKVDMAVFGLPADPISIGQPQVTDGRWLQAGTVGEVVLDRSTARDLDFAVGDTIEFLTAHGKEPLTVVGLAVSGNWGAYPDWDPGLAYALPETLALIESGDMTFTTDQQPYLHGFIPTLQIYLYNLSGGAVSPANTDTSLAYVTQENVGIYLSPSRFEGSTETPPD